MMTLPFNLNLLNQKRLSFLVLFVFFTLFTSVGQMRRLYVDTVSTNNNIQKISFYSPSHGYIASTDNTFDWVGYTADSGRTITKRFITLGNVDYNGYSVNLTFGFGIKGVKAFSQDTIIAYGDYGLVPAILYSTNGGLSYLLVYHSQVGPFTFSTMYDMIFPQNNNIGFAVDGYRIVKTTNKGQNWSAVYSTPSESLGALDAIDNNTVFAFSDYLSGTGGKLLKTINGGNTWQDISIPDPRLFTVDFITPQTGWLNAYLNFDSLLVYYTSNGGSTWTKKNNGEITPIALTEMKFINDSTGYGIGGEFQTYKTSDSGKVWEPLPRDNNFTYLGYGHNDIQILNQNQFWCGGGRDLLEITTNGGGTPIPKAFFKIDTVGGSATNNVNLVNYSRTGYSYKWFLNGVQISTSYHTSYIHNTSQTRDTVKLVVSNGVSTDTSIRYQDFFLPVIISSFSPTIGATGTLVIITGVNLNGATAVRFGGTLASNFTVISSTQVNATVGNGASGAVTVTTPQGTGLRNGFTYFPPPNINLPTSISDSILCKSESITVYIQNTQANVRYDLIDSLNFSYGYVNSNGGSVAFVTTPISRTGNYKIKATRLNVSSTSTFTNPIFILVEHTKSVFTANRVNVVALEKVNFTNQCLEAQTFNWTFNQDPNISSSTLPHPQNIFYATPGQKTVSLISTSPYGCKDTLISDAVYVYTKPVPDEVCYGQAINDSDFAYFPDSPASLNALTLTGDNGYLISGFGNKPKLKSRFGVNKNLAQNGMAYLAKYTTDGTLSWFIHIKNSGKFYATERDNNGNIYVLGTCKVQKYLTLVNGDSIKIAATPTDTISYSSKINGFILKLDSAGNYIWHTVIDDPSPEFQGYPVLGGIPKKLKVQGNQISVAGTFLANLAYCRNGVKQTLFTLQNSTSPNDLQNDFIFRIKEDGSLAWSIYFENNATNLRRGVSAVGIDAGKNYYVTGIYENQVKIHDVGNVNNVTYNGSSGDAGSYLLKFDSTGRLTWKVNLKNTFDFRDVTTNAIAVESAGPVYITGSSSLSNNTQYFQVTNSNGTVSNVSLAAFYILKFDSSGMYKWGTGSRYSYYGQGNSVFLKGSDIYASGAISNNGQSQAQFIVTSTDGNNISLPFYESEFFIANYDTAGLLKRVTKSGNNTGGHLVPSNVIVDNNQNYLISGMADNYNGGNSSFTAFTNTINTDGVDGFFIKLDPNYCYSATPPVANAGPDKTKCAGDTSMIGTPASGNYYSWVSNPAGFVSTSPNPIVSPLVTTSYHLAVINAAGIIARDTVVITVTPAPLANAGIDQGICTGTPATIGSPPVTGNTYSWTSNPAGFNSNLANPVVTPTVNTQYFLAVANSTGCIGKDTVAITVNSTLTPTATISASNTTICSGQGVIFNATITNGGSTPSYQWQVNGTNAGTNSSGFTSSSLANGNQVRVILTSSLSCASPASVTSNIITMTVNNTVTPIILINGNVTVLTGQGTLLSAAIVNGGNNPAYQWQDSTGTHNWQSIAGATATTLNYTPAQTGDKLRCLLTSNATCVTSNTATSNALAFIVNTVTAVDPVPGINYGIIYYPNPASSTLYIDSLRIADKWQTLQIVSMDGKQIMNAISLANQKKKEINVERLLPGQYIAVLRRKSGAPAYLKFIKL